MLSSFFISFTTVRFRKTRVSSSWRLHKTCWRLLSQIETIKRTVRCIERVQLLRSDVHLTLQLLTQKSKTLTPLLSPSFDFSQTKTGELHRTATAAVWSDSHSSLFRKSLVFSFLYESVKFPLWDQDQALILFKSLSICFLFILIFHQFCLSTSSCKRVVQVFTKDSSCSKVSSKQHQDRNDEPITFYKSGHVRVSVCVGGGRRHVMFSFKWKQLAEGCACSSRFKALPTVSSFF